MPLRPVALAVLVVSSLGASDIPSVRDGWVYDRLIPTAGSPPGLAWLVGDPVIAPAPGSWIKAYKDPTFAWTRDANGRRTWHVFTTVANTAAGSLGYFALDDQGNILRQHLVLTHRADPAATSGVDALVPGVRCIQGAPHVFFHARQKQWYLLYQHQYQDPQHKKGAPARIDATQYLAFQTIPAVAGRPDTMAPIGGPGGALAEGSPPQVIRLAADEGDGLPQGFVGLPARMMEGPDAQKKLDYGMFDFWLIDDGGNDGPVHWTYVFYINDQGLVMFSRIKAEEFPGRRTRQDKEGRPRYVGAWDPPQVAICQANKFAAFEGVSVYTLPKDPRGTYRKIPDPKTGKPTGRDARYLLLIECVNNSARQRGPNRYYRAWLSDTLGFGVDTYADYQAGADRRWVQVQDLQPVVDHPFAGAANIRTAKGDPPWTVDVSHGEMARMDNDERMILDLDQPRFLFQGTGPGAGKDYGKIPYRLGILEPDRKGP